MPININGLPPEVLLDIFVPLAQASVNDRGSLMSVCRLWRDLVVETSSMWTKFIVHFTWKHRGHLEDMIASLELQLSRASIQHLDVTWANGMKLPHPMVPRFCELLRRAPFSRWRSLSLHYEYGADTEMFLNLLKDDPGFVNLESLRLISLVSDGLLRHVNETIGPRFRSLTIVGQKPSADLFQKSLTNVLKYLSSIEIYDPGSISSDTLPPNISELTTHCRPNSPLPYIATLHSTFIPSGNFPSLTTLHLKVSPSALMRSPITIPTLQHLLIRGPIYIPLEEIHAPLLCSLTLSYDLVTAAQKSSVIYVANYTLGVVFDQSTTKYTLTPSKLNILQPFQADILESILLHSPTVTSLRIACEEARTAQMVLEFLLRRSNIENMTQGDIVQFAICPQLISLEIIAMWDIVEAREESKIQILMHQVQELRHLQSIRYSHFV